MTAARLGQQVLVCDGAMGTMLHAAGAALDRSLPELNLSDPGLVSTIHDSYLSAGADIIQANTFGANRLWLGDHGFPDKVDEINRAGVRIARAAQDQCEREVLVAGSVSPAVTASQRRRIGSAERAEVIREQVQAITAGRGVDLIILETFGYLDELVEAVCAVTDLTDVPVIAQATFADDAYTLGGETPREVATVLSGLPVAMLGTNCTIGPQRMLTVAEDLVRYASVPVSAQPNAGQPRRTGPRSFEFAIDGGYFARYIRRFTEAGVSLVGGCCGTTPTHIRAAVGAVRDPDAPRDGQQRDGQQGDGQQGDGQRDGQQRDGQRAPPVAAARRRPASPAPGPPRPATVPSPGPWPSSWPAAGSSSRPRSPPRPAAGPARRWRRRPCSRPRASGCSRSSPRRAPAPTWIPWTWPCTCSSRLAWRPSPR